MAVSALILFIVLHESHQPSISRKQKASLSGSGGTQAAKLGGLPLSVLALYRMHGRMVIWWFDPCMELYGTMKEIPKAQRATYSTVLSGPLTINTLISVLLVAW